MNQRRRQSRVRVVRSVTEEVVVRGTIKQVIERYETLATEARNEKDHVLAERYLQAAEHWKREGKNDVHI